MTIQEKIQHHIDNAKAEMNSALQMSYEYGSQQTHNESKWLTSRDSLVDGSYVGVLESGGKVFVSVTNGKLYPVEYCKRLVKWCKLPD